MIRKEAWPFYRPISGVLLCWELEELKGPNGVHLLAVLRQVAGPSEGLAAGGAGDGEFPGVCALVSR